MINWLACRLIGIIIWQILIPMIVTGPQNSDLIISTSSSTRQFQLISRILWGKQICYPRTFRVSHNSQSKLTPLSNSHRALLQSKREVPPFFRFTKRTFSSWHAAACWPRKKRTACVAEVFFPVELFLKCPISAIVVALFWPYTEQFSPSQISFHHSKKRCNIMVWRFCLWNAKKWKAVPLGLIIFLLFNKYLGIVSVLESKRHLTYAGHVAAHMGDISRLSQLGVPRIRLARILPPPIALTRAGGGKKGCRTFLPL